MIIYVDIDETICLSPNAPDYNISYPIYKNIEYVNRLYDEGHTIVYWTARGSKTGLDWKEKTLVQFKDWNVKYHELKFGKPNYDYFIDDKNINTYDLDKITFTNSAIISSKYRKHKINTENPFYHWEFFDCRNKRVLDLGCGKWEHIEYRDKSWPTTPEFFLMKGASDVIGIDIDQQEVNWYNQLNNPQILSECFNISSIEILSSIIKKYQPTAIKCDIEGNEQYLFNLESELFKSIDTFAIETHSDILYEQAMSKLINEKYYITDIIYLDHAPSCKVIFAKGLT